jgi:hypothetical protein
VIYKALAALAIAGAIAAGGYFKGLSVGRVELERAKAVWQAQYDVQVAETQRVQLAWNTSKEQNDAWKTAADTAGADAAAVARQLRNYKARASRCALPDAAADTGGTGSPGTEFGDIGGIEERHFRNCAADATDYDTFRAWYNGLREAQ